MLRLPNPRRRLEPVATDTQELLERARSLAMRSATEDSLARVEFEQALDRLRRLAGKPARYNEGTRFETAVAAILFRLPDVIVALSPKTARTPHRPDFIVRKGDEVILVDAKSGRPGSRFTHKQNARELERALPAFNATRGVIVVPDKSYSPVARVDASPHVSLVQLSQLDSYLDEPPRGAVN